MVDLEPLWIEPTWINIGMIVLACVTLFLIFSIGFCFMYRIRFEQQRFGPALFIYTYHVGSFYSIGNTISKLAKQFEDKKGLSIVANKLKMQESNLSQANAGIFYDDPKRVEASELRSAVGVLIPLPKSALASQVTMKACRKILSKLEIEGAYLRVLPKINYLVSFYPKYFGVLSYMIGPMRTYPEAERQEIIKAPPMELFEHSKILGHSSDNYISYMFAQDNFEAFDIDIDMARPSDKKKD